MALGPFALSLWAGLKAWRGVDVHLRLNKTMSIAFSAFGVVDFSDIHNVKGIPPGGDHFRHTLHGS